MKQTSSLTQNLANAQEQHANAQRHAGPAFNTVKTLFRIYTEDTFTESQLADYIGRYFAGATVYRGIGLDARTQEDTESAVIIEIVSSLPDALQRVTFLAGDLREAGKQISVLLTKQDVTTFEITADTPLREARARWRTHDTVTDSPTVNLRSRAQAHRLSGLDGL